jgi:hypothetical protein
MLRNPNIYTRKPQLYSHVLLFCLDLFPHGATPPPVDQDLIIIDASRSHSDTTHPIWLLWTSDRPNAVTSTRQHQTETSMPPVGFETRNTSKQAPQTQALERSATAFGLNHSSHSCQHWHYLLIHNVHKTAATNTGFFALGSFYIYHSNNIIQ